MGHVARGLGRVGGGELALAGQELAEAVRLAATLPEDAMEFFNSARKLADIGTGLLAGELALAHGRTDEGLARLRAAVDAEDQTRYDEPPDWYLPVRHFLGRALLRSGRPAEADAVFAPTWRVIRKTDGRSPASPRA